MPNLRDIRRRIKAVRNTAQITRAMQMVAASKMRKAQLKALAGRPYAEQLNRVLAGLLTEDTRERQPLMHARPVRQRAVILIGSDKGLCGALNGNLFRLAQNYDPATTSFITVGRKAAQFVARSRRRLLAEFTYHDPPAFAEARAISRFACNEFLQQQTDAVDLVYTEYVSTLVQKPMARPFLPIGVVTRLTAGVDGQALHENLLPEAATAAAQPADFLFEPSPEQIFSNLLPHHLNFLVFQLLLEARASEHSARMVAMKNATENARDLIADLTLEYNGLRQAGITRELLEISSAALATES
jgi:F-type H+-transporting ATPase subunit gamma